MNTDQLAKAWLKTHPRLSAATLHDAESAGFELLEVHGKPVLAHGSDISTIEDAIAGVATALPAAQEAAPTEELAQLRAELAEARQRATSAHQRADLAELHQQQAEERLEIEVKAHKSTHLALTEARHEAIHARTERTDPLIPLESHPSMANAIKDAIARLDAALANNPGACSAGERAYRARAAGQRWTDLPPGSREYARSHARRRNLPWPPKQDTGKPISNIQEEN